MSRVSRAAKGSWDLPCCRTRQEKPLRRRESWKIGVRTVLERVSKEVEPTVTKTVIVVIDSRRLGGRQWMDIFECQWRWTFDAIFRNCLVVQLRWLYSLGDLSGD